MKKHISVILLVGVLALLLINCHGQKVYPFLQAYDEIQTIEIVEIANPRIVATGHFEAIKVLATIQTDQWEQFVDGFRTVPCYKSFGNPAGFVEGDAIRITYRDGSFELICEMSAYFYEQDGTWRYPSYYFDQEGFSRLIDEWS